MNDDDLMALANAAHHVGTLLERVDVDDLIKRIERGERTALLVSDEQAKNMVRLLRALRRCAAEVKA